MTIRLALSELYRKNRDDLRALFLGEYPPFFYRSSRGIGPEEIPVFAFHSVLPDRFDSQMAFLVDNGYRTLDADGLVDILLRRGKIRENTIVLTFDDGRGSVWATAYPILKKYGLQAIAFIVPSRIRETVTLNPNLDDVREGRTDMANILARESIEPFLTWNEIRTMHRSGVIDFQSHSSWHHSIFVSARIVEFANPAFNGSFLKGSLHPVIRRGGRDEFPEGVDWGSPIYEWGPGLGSERRYLEDEDLTQVLTHHVRKNGGIMFFRRPGWRNSLRGLAGDYARRDGGKGRFQTAEERYADIYSDLLQSRKIIEEKIGNRVIHLCYPWYQGCEMAVRASRAAGYESNYWGVSGGRAINRVGNDPYHVARIIDDYLFLLPGRGRENLRRVLEMRARGIAARRLAKWNAA
jgi:peptidoglycan/xylan/chitin deacetylase (PgdA/CDA1 family)